MGRASKAYAVATHAFAVSEDQVEDWYGKMLLLQQIKHPALKNPFVSDEVAQVLVESLDLSEAQKQWIYLLQKDKCIHLLKPIAQQFIILYQSQNNIKPVSLVTARDLNDTEKNQFYQKLATIFKQKITLQFVVQPEIIGGVQLEHSGQLIDLSYAKILNQLHTKT